MANGIRAYEDARYAQAAQALQAALPGLAVADQVVALKYLAFVSCSQARRAECRQYFERIFALQPGFELTPAENGHPMWGPIYRELKQRRAPAPTPAPRRQ